MQLDRSERCSSEMTKFETSTRAQPSDLMVSTLVNGQFYLRKPTLGQDEGLDELTCFTRVDGLLSFFTNCIAPGFNIIFFVIIVAIEEGVFGRECFALETSNKAYRCAVRMVLFSTPAVGERIT